MATGVCRKWVCTRVAWGKMGQLGKMGHLTNDSIVVKLRSDEVFLHVNSKGQCLRYLANEKLPQFSFWQ